MATLTKKDLLEAIEDMPMDAEIWKITIIPQGVFPAPATGVECLMEDNIINIC